MKTRMRQISIILLLVCLAGCTDARRSFMTAGGEIHMIEVLDCSGNSIKEYRSTGMPSNIANGQGIFFRDKKTLKYVQISGPVIITEL